jgi:hypothetical protein
MIRWDDVLPGVTQQAAAQVHAGGVSEGQLWQRTGGVACLVCTIGAGGGGGCAVEAPPGWPKPAF